MNDKEFIKKILQEQEIKLHTINFTQKIMHRIAVQQEQKKSFSKTILYLIVMGLLAWIYITIKPYFQELILPIVQMWEIQNFSILLSLPYLICYLIVLGAIAFFFYENETNISPKI